LNFFLFTRVPEIGIHNCYEEETKAASNLKLLCFYSSFRSCGSEKMFTEPSWVFSFQHSVIVLIKFKVGSPS
jgi:hypothetical protein